jgi:hypothetical protein
MKSSQDTASMKEHPGGKFHQLPVTQKDETVYGRAECQQKGSGSRNGASL